MAEALGDAAGIEGIQLVGLQMKVGMVHVYAPVRVIRRYFSDDKIVAARTCSGLDANHGW
jgi:hypothetical protein